VPALSRASLCLPASASPASMTAIQTSTYQGTDTPSGSGFDTMYPLRLQVMVLPPFVCRVVIGFSHMSSKKADGGYCISRISWELMYSLSHGDVRLTKPALHQKEIHDHKTSACNWIEPTFQTMAGRSARDGLMQLSTSPYTYTQNNVE